MKFRFPYINDTTIPLASVPRPSYPSPYLWHPRALVTVRLSGPQRTRPVTPVLVDTGATETLFKHHYAQLLGVMLTTDPTWRITWKGTAHAIGYGEVTLELTDVDGNRLQWKATVGFTTAPLLHEGLLGFLGCLRYMDAWDRRENEQRFRRGVGQRSGAGVGRVQRFSPLGAGGLKATEFGSVELLPSMARRRRDR